MMDFSAVDVVGEIPGNGLLERLDLKNMHPASGGREMRFDCYGAEHGDGGSMYINVETTAFFCHGCKRRGNAITLIMEVQQVERPTAERFLREWYGIDFLEPIGGSMAAEIEARFREIPEPPAPVPPPRSWLSSVRLDWAVENQSEEFESYMLGRGFLPQTLSDWDIGYDYQSDRLTIPVFDIEDNLVGIKGRAWRPDHQPKYLILGDRPGYTANGFTPYEASQVVFGLHRNRARRMVVLCEGELNAIALSQLGVVRPVATGMSYFTERHAQLITREAEEVVIYYDDGPAGYRGMWGGVDASGKFKPGAIQFLEDHVTVRVVYSPPDDPSKLVELGRGDEALQLINDAPTSLALRIAFR